MNYKFSVPQGWNESQLQDYCLKVADGTHDSPKKTERGKLLVTSKNIIGGTLDLSKSYRISEEDFNDVNRRSKVDKNDVLLSMIGTVGEVCLIESEPDFAIKNVGLLKNQDPLKAKWLFFYLTSPQAQAQIKERLRGTTQQYLPLGEIRKFPIIYPKSRTEMQEIVGVLAALQDKIQLNHQINQTLEQMAQAIFKSWFVDFEPVKAKIAALEAGGSEEDALLAAMQAISGKGEAELTRLQAEQPEQYAELRATAELFPAAMQDSELGEIPEGWSVGAFKDLCLRVESGGTPKRSEPSYWGDEIKWLSSGEVRDIIAFETKEKITHSGLKNSSAKLWPKYTTVVAMYGATAGQVCLLADEMTSNQACCGLIPRAHHQAFMFISARNSTSSLAEKASGSAQQNLNKALVSNHISLLPPDSILALYESIALPLLDAWIQNSLQNKKLGEVRDALLPKLLSGELCVSAVDDHLATVAEAANV